MTDRPYRRARRAFWTLGALAVLLVGALSYVLQTEPSPRVGLAVPALGTLTVVALGLAVRVLLALTGQLRLPPAPDD